MKFDIAVGTSRTQKMWRNKKMTWEDFLKKISITETRHLTYAEYLKADKAVQANIKDVGGFVGGYLNEGRRKPGNVKHRQLITLDADFADVGFWDDFTMYNPYAAAIYSTHKHHPKQPRFRLIIPLSRAVSSEEYEAAARWIANSLGMEQFDSTTFQPERLMYWPSTSKDGEFIFEQQETDYFLNPDDILDQYDDWKDVSAWPMHDNEKEIIKLGLGNKQEDPTTKAGLIGAFCRAYPITEAMDEFIPDAYEEGNGANRYTYSGSETGSGAIVYDDLWLYSNHHSDPCSQKLVNAFDLVRIHLYGHLDTGKNPDTPVTQLRSYKEMITLLNNDANVTRELGIHLDFPEGPWLIDLEYQKNGTELEITIDNLLLILRNDPNLEGAFAYNKFDYRDYILKPLPWNQDGEVRIFDDKDDSGLRHYLEKRYGIFHEKKTRDALDIILIDNAFHPVLDYLNTLKWDGEERIEKVFIDSLGADDSPYIRAVTKKALVACVARVMQPGCKFDNILTLVGGQGLGKSTVLRELGRSWFSDSFGNIQSKEAYEQLIGVWLMEMGELAGLRKAESENVKHFTSKQDDKYRVAYGRRVSTFYRQNVFFGSTNVFDFLKDMTGNRRWWPVIVKEKYMHKTLNIDQIWAEAVTLYHAGEPLHLNDETEAIANLIQKNHLEAESWSGLIENYLSYKLPLNWDKMGTFERKSWISAEEIGENELAPGVIERDKVCIAEIWCEVFGAPLKDMNGNNTKIYHSIMSNMPGWERGKLNKFNIYGTQRAYVKIKESGKRKEHRNEIAGQGQGDWWESL